MGSDTDNKKNNRVQVSATEYEIQKLKRQGIDPETFDFDTEFAKGLTPEKFKAEMSKRIKAYS
ncbi:hypothetical protein ACFSJW_09425 [Flavobacterium artemisiae]|uniref:Antitoxin VbhA domain-containing protein n=1 Tax=Flavobacterium artemisiae TaxID=2126556 RepID=A0ABW4HF25_9FLAO